jgi:hypothetical protein
MKSAYLPGQHGAWAMLAVPFLLGAAVSGPVWLHAPLFAFWLSAYLFSFPFLQWIKTKNRRRYGRPMLVYGLALAACGLALAAAKPALLLWAPLFVPLFLVNVRYARLNRERALVNDLAAVVQFGLIIFVAWAAADAADWRKAGTLFALHALYFFGTVLYVKTVIREKHNPRYHAASVVYHALLPAAAAAFRIWPLALVAVPLLLRAVLMPRANPNVKTVGMLEFANAVLFTIAVLFWVS